MIRPLTDGRLVEMAELRDHPFIGTFHPEFKSRPLRPHPLFRGFVAACRDQRKAPEEGSEEAAREPSTAGERSAR